MSRELMVLVMAVFMTQGVARGLFEKDDVQKWHILAKASASLEFGRAAQERSMMT
jgi:hypothetical protein